MSFSDHALAKGEVAIIVKAALNAGSNDAEHDALVELADMVGLEYDEEKDVYE